jgi:hypothetical protein
MTQKNKMTAVELLVEKWSTQGTLYISDISQAKEMENEQMINFALFRDDYLEKANTLEDFTIQNEKLIRLFKYETFKLE